MIPCPGSGVQVGHVRRSDGRSVAFGLAGDTDGEPVLVCHGLADSRHCAALLGPAARALGLLVVVPERPGVGLTPFYRLERLADWVGDAVLVLDALGVQRAAVVGISGGGPYAAACAAGSPARVSALLLVTALGMPDWKTAGMAGGQRWALALARRAPDFGGWFMERLALLAGRSPGLFFQLATSEMPDVDRETLSGPEQHDAFIAGYREAFRRGSQGVAQDLRLLTRPWGVHLGAISAPTFVHHGDADTTVPLDHARRYASCIARARLHVHAGHGHFSLLAAAAGGVLADARRRRGV